MKKNFQKKQKFVSFASLIRRLATFNAKMENFANDGLSAKELFECKVHTMVETLLSIYIFGNKTQCYNHWCVEISTVLTNVMNRLPNNENVLERIFEVMHFMDVSPNLYSYCYTVQGMEKMLRKVEKHEKGILKQRKIERYQEFLISALIAIKSQVNRNPKGEFGSYNVRNALAIYADLDDLYFKENPDVERSNYEFFSKKY